MQAEQRNPLPRLLKIDAVLPDVRVAPDDREYLDRRLSTLPRVPEEEYFLFTTRFEVVEVASEAFVVKMEEEGYGGIEYTSDDYAFDYGPS